MEFKDQDVIQVHPIGIHDYKACIKTLVAISNNNGVFAYFTSEKTALNFAQNIAITLNRLELLLDTIDIKESDENSYNELEFIYSELKYMKEIFNN